MPPEELPELAPEVLADPAEATDAGPAEDAPESPAAITALATTGSGQLAPYDPFRRYVAELKKYPPLSREEERALAKLYRETGDREALFRLVSANLMLVVRVALSFRRAAHNLLDLIQEGNLGLLMAIDRFDPEVGARLPTYAAWWVRAYMVKFLLDNVRLVRVGTTNARRRLLRNLRKEKARLEEQGFDVGTKLLAEHFGVSEVDVTDVQAALESHDVSLDAPADDSARRGPAEFLPADSPTAEEEFARKELQQRAEAAITRFRKDLPERDRTILDLRLLSDDPLTLQALGDRFGTTREAVRQGEARLKARLAEFLRAELGDLGHVNIGE